MEGLALLRKSFVALYGEKDPSAGLNLATQAATATARASHVLAGLGVLHCAEAHAMLGGRSACEHALSRTEELFGRVEPCGVAIELFSSSVFSRVAGSCYLSLGETKRAAPILAEAAMALQDRSKAQAIVLGNLSLAYLRQGQLDEAAAHLNEAMDIIEVTWGGGGLNVASRACRELAPWGQVPAVRQVQDRLLSLIAA